MGNGQGHRPFGAELGPPPIWGRIGTPAHLGQNWDPRPFGAELGPPPFRGRNGPPPFWGNIGTMGQWAFKITIWSLVCFVRMQRNSGKCLKH